MSDSCSFCYLRSSSRPASTSQRHLAFCPSLSASGHLLIVPLVVEHLILGKSLSKRQFVCLINGLEQSTVCTKNTYPTVYSSQSTAAYCGAQKVCFKKGLLQNGVRSLSLPEHICQSLLGASIFHYQHVYLHWQMHTLYLSSSH